MLPIELIDAILQYLAVKSETCHIVFILHDYAFQRTLNTAMRYINWASIVNDCDQDVVKYLHNSHPKFPTWEIIYRTCTTGNIELFKFLSLKNNIRINISRIFETACENGHLSFVEESRFQHQTNT